MTATTPIVTIRVDQLRVGDVLWPTMRTVLWAGQTIKTPSGKRCIQLDKGGGYWWKATTVSIIKTETERT